MEKIFEDFNRNETMMMFETHGIFPNEVFSLYVQTKEDIYIEFDMDDIIKENFFQRKEKIEKELNESYNKLIKVPKEELLERLKGKAKGVQLLEKGIYIIFNDKADITYEEFVEMNNIFKPLLGLI